MLIELSLFWLIVCNVLGWPLIHFGIGWWITQRPGSRFNPEAGLFRQCTWENNGRFYERFFAIKRWKGRLPDAAPWFSNGFAKKNLPQTTPDFLRRYIQETCRGELAHWMMFATVPVFFLWNPWWGDLVMIVYAVLANAPCILSQRYNRIRLHRLLRAKGTSYSSI